MQRKRSFETISHGISKLSPSSVNSVEITPCITDQPSEKRNKVEGKIEKNKKEKEKEKELDKQKKGKEQKNDSSYTVQNFPSKLDQYRPSHVCRLGTIIPTDLSPCVACFHPIKEGHLLVGFSEGSVGLYNVITSEKLFCVKFMQAAINKIVWAAEGDLFGNSLTPFAHSRSYRRSKGMSHVQLSGLF